MARAVKRSDAWRMRTTTAALPVLMACAATKSTPPPEAALAPPAAKSARRPPRPTANDWSSCPFPEASDKAGIDSAVVVVDIAVDATGRVTDVDVLSDPGWGFGETARQCTRAAWFEPARDDAGRAIAARTGPFRVRFERPSPDER